MKAEKRAELHLSAYLGYGIPAHPSWIDRARYKFAVSLGVSAPALLRHTHSLHKCLHKCVSGPNGAL